MVILCNHQQLKVTPLSTLTSIAHLLVLQNIRLEDVKNASQWLNDYRLFAQTLCPPRSPDEQMWHFRDQTWAPQERWLWESCGHKERPRKTRLASAIVSPTKRDAPTTVFHQLAHACLAPQCRENDEDHDQTRPDAAKRRSVSTTRTCHSWRDACCDLDLCRNSAVRSRPYTAPQDRFSASADEEGVMLLTELHLRLVGQSSRRARWYSVRSRSGASNCRMYGLFFARALVAAFRWLHTRPPFLERIAKYV
ncbi:hypothetical protein BD413DRAFT_41641 [Trametes elegans]|nr:hypothetical protein BD413DRAFT_41641 [Trametes elegans]